MSKAIERMIAFGALEMARDEADDAAAKPALEAKINSLEKKIEALNKDIDAEKTVSEGLRQELSTKHDGPKVAELDQRLEREIAARGQALADLAAEKTVSEGLRGQLDAERTARAAMDASLQAALKSIAAHQAKPPIEPPTYEMVITSRDLNHRPQKILLMPVKGK